MKACLYYTALHKKNSSHRHNICEARTCDLAADTKRSLVTRCVELDWQLTQYEG